MNVQWTDSRNPAILKKRTESVSYPTETDYTDDSKSILAEIQDEEDVKIENCSSDSDNEESSVEFQYTIYYNSNRTFEVRVNFLAR